MTQVKRNKRSDLTILYIDTNILLFRYGPNYWIGLIKFILYKALQ